MYVGVFNRKQSDMLCIHCDMCDQGSSKTFLRHFLFFDNVSDPSLDFILPRLSVTQTETTGLRAGWMRDRRCYML